MKYFLAIGATLLIFISSCTTLVPYSRDLSSELNLPEDQLKQVQFYVSQTIILERAQTAVNTYTQKGALVVQGDQSVDRVVIQQGTPGTVIKKADGQLFVSFEDDPNKFLVFGLGDKGEKYYLQAKEWKNGKGIMDYGKAVYHSSQGSGDAHLLMEVKTQKNTNNQTRVATGRKL